MISAHGNERIELKTHRETNMGAGTSNVFRIKKQDGYDFFKEEEKVAKDPGAGGYHR